MGYVFYVGDYVCWNFEVGYVSGYIIKVYMCDVDYKGYIYCCMFDDLQYEIVSDVIDYVVLYKGSVLYWID